MATSTNTSPDWQCNKTLGQCIQYAFLNKVSTDITFKVVRGSTTEKVEAHKLILGMRSPVFHAMFFGSMMETNAEITIEDVDYNAFNELIRFVYTDEAIITGDNVQYILYAAKKYIIPALVSKCGVFLEHLITPNTVLIALHIGMQFEEQGLIQKCLKTVTTKTKEVTQSSHWGSMKLIILDTILDQPKLSITEMELFRACVRWAGEACLRANISATAENKRHQLGQMLYKIDLGKVSLEEFSTEVSESGILDEREELALYRKLSKPGNRHEIPFKSGRVGYVSTFVLTTPACPVETKHAWMGTDEDAFYGNRAHPAGKNGEKSFKWTLQVSKCICLECILIQIDGHATGSINFIKQATRSTHPTGQFFEGLVGVQSHSMWKSPPKLSRSNRHPNVKFNIKFGCSAQVYDPQNARGKMSDILLYENDIQGSMVFQDDRIYYKCDLDDICLVEGNTYLLTASSSVAHIPRVNYKHTFSDETLKCTPSGSQPAVRVAYKFSD